MNPAVKGIWKLVTNLSVFLYRASGGKIGGKMRDFNALLLTTTGRKTGKERTTPLGYIRDGGNYVIIASNAGLDYHPAWYYNLQNNPMAQIQVRDLVLNVKAQTARGDQRQRLWAQLRQRQWMASARQATAKRKEAWK